MITTSLQNMGSYSSRLTKLYAELGISHEQYKKRGLVMHEEAQELVRAATNGDGQTVQLTPTAFKAWQQMQQDAITDSVELLLDSGFRSINYQAQIITRELKSGSSLAEILTWIAAPGYSEHHTGRALDIVCPECPATTTEFDQTDAFAWLQKNANRYGFFLSYPPQNPYGIIYEPWHWCFQEK